MLLKTDNNFKNFLFLQECLKWLEVFFASTFFVGLFWFFYLSLCRADSCKSFWLSTVTQNFVISAFFITWGFLNSLRIGVVFLLNDPDDEPEILFYISLVGLFLCNLLIGLFFPDFVSRADKNQVDTPAFIALIIILMSTVASLLVDKQNWDKSTTFVKARISLTILELVVLLVNPYLGIITAVIILPLSVVLNGGLEASDDE